MAIVQASLTEEILSRSERAVIRGIYRASQLADAKVALLKCKNALPIEANTRLVSSVPSRQHIELLEKYFDSAISSALLNTKVPAQRTSTSTLTEE